MRPDANANADADADADPNRSKTICRPPLKGVDIIINASFYLLHNMTVSQFNKYKKSYVHATLFNKINMPYK